MIFDMTRRVSGGGGGPSASDAILTVTVPTGSTVTMTKGGLSLTPTMWVQAADNTLDCALFVISPSLFDAQNPWTVTATLGTDTASDTVTVDSNEQYDVELGYGLYFIKNGQILVPKAPYSSSNWEASIEQVDGAVKVTYRGDGGSAGVLWKITESLLNGKVYTNLVARVRSWNVSVNNEMSQISICDSNYVASRNVYTNAYGTTFPGYLIVDCTIVNLTNKYAGIRVASSGVGGIGVAVIEDFYLAR